MHDVRVVDPSGKKYIVEIDGVHIALSAAANKIPCSDIEALRAYIDALETKVEAGEPLVDLRPVVNGTNMLRILEALFRPQTLKNWAAVLDAHPERSPRASFEAYFGYVHNTTNCPSEFAAELYAMANERWKTHRKDELLAQKEAEAEEQLRKAKFDRVSEYANKVSALELRNRAMSDDWFVERKRIVSNVVVYSVNGAEVEICLSGRQEFGDAFKVVSYLTEMQEALEQNNLDKVSSLIRESGGKAGLEILEKLFHDRSVAFFRGQQRQMAINDRALPKPHTFLKRIIGGTQFAPMPFGDELLKALESDLPDIEHALVSSSDDEIKSDKLVWSLFYIKLGRLFHTDIVFPASQSLRSQMQSYYRLVAAPYINSGLPYAEQLYKINGAITSLLRYMGDDQKAVCSMLDLSSWDFKYAITRMYQDGFSPSTVRKDLILFKRCIYHLNSSLADKVIPATIIPLPMINPTQPLPPSVFSQIKTYEDCIPRCIWLAFLVYEEIGGRSTSVLNLITDDFLRIDDFWALRITNYKEIEKNALAGAPNESYHKLGKKLGEELDKFIADTAELRKQLDKPYIFVYESKTFRDSSKRRPMVLTSNSYNDFMTKLCKEKGIYTPEGFVQAPSARSIRAEVGRSLFKRGWSAEMVSEKLGNTPEMAAISYNTMYPEDDAAKRRALYAETIDPKIGTSSSDDQANIIEINTPMYGGCDQAGKCGNCNDCRECSQRIVDKSKAPKEGA